MFLNMFFQSLSYGCLRPEFAFPTPSNRVGNANSGLKHPYLMKSFSSKPYMVLCNDDYVKMMSTSMRTMGSDGGGGLVRSGGDPMAVR
jgi:hypothetical protein